MNSEDTIKKFDEEYGVKRKRRSSSLWLAVLIPVYAAIIGVAGRLSVEFFQWGWDLFGWA